MALTRVFPQAVDVIFPSFDMSNGNPTGAWRLKSGDDVSWDFDTGARTSTLTGAFHLTFPNVPGQPDIPIPFPAASSLYKFGRKSAGPNDTGAWAGYSIPTQEVTDAAHALSGDGVVPAGTPGTRFLIDLGWCFFVWYFNSSLEDLNPLRAHELPPDGSAVEMPGGPLDIPTDDQLLEPMGSFVIQVFATVEVHNGTTFDSHLFRGSQQYSP